MKRIAAIAISAIALTGCTDTSPTLDPMGSVGRTASYSVVTDWTRIPSNNDQATDVWVRIIKIEGVCFTQTNSVHDWEYSLVPTGAAC